MFQLNQVYYLFPPYHVLSSSLLHNILRKRHIRRVRAFPLGTLQLVDSFKKTSLDGLRKVRSQRKIDRGDNVTAGSVSIA